MRAATLTETIYERMRGDLLTGVFVPGTPLRLEDVRQRYDVSTSPLREAMFRLEAEGFLLLSSQRGFRVAPLSRDDLLDLTERRIEIETRALGLSIAKGDEEWESEVVKRQYRFGLITKQVQTGKKNFGTEWEERHRALHLALIEACGSPRLQRFCMSLYDHFDRYRRLARLRPKQLLTKDEDAIVASALQRNEAKAVEILIMHIQRTSDDVCQALFGNSTKDAAA
jgi:GntR family transcriptional regulator, carbon starvation induced regulator